MMKKIFILAMAAGAAIACSVPKSGDLPRVKPSAELEAAFRTFQDSVAATMADPSDWERMLNLHSMMVVKDGSVVLEKSFSEEWPAERPHPMFSVSKSFTAAALGLAIADGKLSLDDQVAAFFPDKVREDNPCRATVRDLLMMAGGHDTDPTGTVGVIDPTAMRVVLKEGVDIAGAFFSHPFVHEPGTYFCYNSLGSYLLSAIVQKVTGETVLDYLTPRLFEPLGIAKPEWETDENGIGCGGWGLSITTEDMAKFGLLYLQKGRWEGKQLIPEEWVEEMSSFHIANRPAGMTPEQVEALGIPASENDWIQGYGYQMWRNTHEGYRADGAMGQFILVLPEKNAVVVLTAKLANTQQELHAVWKYLYPAL